MQTNKKPTLELKANILKTLLEWMVASGKLSFQIYLILLFIVILDLLYNLQLVHNLRTWFFLSKYYYL